MWPRDPWATVRPPRAPETLAERIASSGEIARLLAAAPSGRDRLMLRTLYAGALRASELCGLRWRNVRPAPDGAALSVFGKTRPVLIPGSLGRELLASRAGAPDGAPVFRSRRGGAISPRRLNEVVKAAAAAAGLDPRLSPHWLRHAHASHALDAGAPISLVQRTLGHASVATTSRYLHARPDESSGSYLGGL